MNYLAHLSISLALKPNSVVGGAKPSRISGEGCPPGVDSAGVERGRYVDRAMECFLEPGGIGV